MKQKLAVLFVTAALALCALPMAVSAEGNVAKIGDNEYATLQKAVDAVTDNTPTTIKLLDNASGGGVIVPSDRSITFDLDGHTYTVSENTVGSSGTETNGFQLLRDSTVAFQNGKLTSTASTCQMLIQNYCNLTLLNVDLDGTGLTGSKYVLSNNFGNTQITGSTSIKAPTGGVAFDVYYWPGGGYPGGVSVTVNTTGSINGKIEYGCDSTGVNNVAGNAILSIQNGTFNGSLSTSLTYTGITVVGGSFSDASFANYCEDGKTLVQDPNGMFVPQPKPVVATVDGKDYYSLAEAATAAAATTEKALTLKADATLDSMLTINTPGMVIDLGGFTVSASDKFQKDANNNNNNHLVDITADNVTLKNGTLKAGANNNHTLNVWNAKGVQLSGLKLDNAASYGGAPLIVGASAVTVNDGLNVVTGANSWYGINVDSRNVGSVSNPNNKGASITVAPNVSLVFEGQKSTGIYMENSAGMNGNDVKLGFGSGVTFNSSIPSFVPVVVATGDSATVTDPGNAGLQDNGDGTFSLKPAPTPKPEEPWTPGPTATPAPAQVLDSTPKTGAVSLAVLPLAGLAFAGLGFVTRKREE